MTVLNDHGRIRYAKGCRSDQCKAAQSDYKRQYRARKKARELGVSLSAVPTPSPAADPAPGRVEAAVMAEIGMIPGADRRPGLIELAPALARVVDNRVAVAQHASAGHRLVETLNAVHKLPAAGGGKLQAVKAMRAFFTSEPSTNPMCQWINDPREPEELPPDWVPEEPPFDPLPDDPPF